MGEKHHPALDRFLTHILCFSLEGLWLRGPPKQRIGKESGPLQCFFYLHMNAFILRAIIGLEAHSCSIYVWPPEGLTPRFGEGDPPAARTTINRGNESCRGGGSRCLNPFSDRQKSKSQDVYMFPSGGYSSFSNGQEGFRFLWILSCVWESLPFRSTIR